MSLNELAARLMDAVSINETKQVNGKFLKWRRWGRGWLITIGNIFLRWSNSQIVMFPNTEIWQARECYSYYLLYGGGCQLVGTNALLIQPFPGESIRHLIETKRLTREAIATAAREFRRVHVLNWSHGDPHLTNVLFDGERVRLIDFETKHEPSLSPVERYADDLLVFLLDLIGRDPDWRESSKTFLHAYDDSEVLKALQSRLHLPTGLEIILWKSRTNYLPRSMLAERLTNLKQTIEGLICLPD